jgi:hypothetical protein
MLDHAIIVRGSAAFVAACDPANNAFDDVADAIEHVTDAIEDAAYDSAKAEAELGMGRRSGKAQKGSQHKG